MGSPSMPKAPPPPPPPAMPIDPAVLERRRRARANTRSARASSIFTGPQGIVNRGALSPATLLGGGNLGGGGGA